MLTGIGGFMWIENYNLLDAFYMTVITIATVGFMEVHPLSPEGRLFVSLLIMINVITFTYAFTSLSSFLLEGGIKEMLKTIKMTNKIDELKNHVVVCGYGRIGRQVCKELYLEKQRFVVIEKDESHAKALEQSGFLYIMGEATDDAVLDQARIRQAHALITTLPDDGDNVYVVLSAREANPYLQIISRIQNDRSESKLKRAGCDFTVMPERIGGSHMATIVTKPDILKFLQLLTAPGGTDLYFGEVKYEKELSGKTLRELDVRAKTGVNIIGFKLPNGDFIVNPSPDTRFEANTKIIVLGNKDQINKFNEIIRST
jgi:voltage-gated potassium channel